ncbi:MAG: hypothetical protein COB53_06310 [Elusimicrobia bacterium]|nr:MAG: hypothetical protein COB53_06310 [Elusimicrobiota bacterium]
MGGARTGKALRDELKNSIWSSPIPEAPLDPEPIMDLGIAIRSVPSQIVINRNNTFFRWKHALQDGHPKAVGISFNDASVRTIGKDVEITFGTIEGQKIRVRLDGRMGTPEDTAEHINSVIALARTYGTDPSGLERVGRELRAKGLVGANWQPPS